MKRLINIWMCRGAHLITCMMNNFFQGGRIALTILPFFFTNVDNTTVRLLSGYGYN